MADRYWVGGTAAWDGTAGTKWATTTGGAGGASVPTIADNVFLDANSGANTVTVSAGNTGCADLTCTGFTGTLTGAAALTIAGSLLLVAGMTHTYSGQPTFSATAAGKTITSGGQLLTSASCVFNGAGGGWTLQDNFRCAGRIELVNGTFDTGANRTITTTNIVSGGFFTSGSGTCALNLNASTINHSGVFGIQFAANTGGFTLNAGTSTINLSSNAVQFNGGGKTFSTVVFNPANSFSPTFFDSNTFGTLTFAPTGSVPLPFATFGANQTVTGTFTASGATAGTRMWLRSDVPGTQRTISAAVYAPADVVFQDINAAGAAAPFTGTRLGDGKGNSNITFTAAATKFWTGGSGTWNTTCAQFATASGGGGALNNLPLPQDDVVFDANSFSADGQSCTVTSAAYLKALDFSAVDQAITLNCNGGSMRIHGDVTLKAGMTWTGGGGTTLCGRNTQLIASNGVTWAGQPWFIESPGGTVRLADALTVSGTIDFTLTAGTLDLNGKALTVPKFTDTGSNIAHAITSGGLPITITRGGAAETVVNITGGAAFTANDPCLFDCTYSGAVSTRSIAISGLLGEANSPSVKISAGTDTVAFSFASGVKNLDFTGFAGTLTNTQRTIYGDLTLASGMTLTAGGSVTTFTATSGIKNITSNTKTLDFPVTFDGAGGTWKAVDALTMGATRTMTLTRGTFDINGQTVSVGQLSMSNANVRELKSGAAGGTLATTDTTAAATVINAATATNLTITRNSWSIEIGGNTANTRTLQLSNKTWPKITFTNTTAAGKLALVGNGATLKALAVTSPPQTIERTAGENMNIEDGPVAFPSGTPGNLVTIQSATAASHTWTKTGGGFISSDYLSISRATGSPATLTWFAGAHSTDGGNNSGIIFTPPPLIVAIVPAASTETAQAFGRISVKALVGAASAETAQAFGRLRRKALVGAASAETAQLFSARSRMTLTMAFETDLARAIPGVKRKLLQQAVETTLAQALRGFSFGEGVDLVRTIIADEEDRSIRVEAEDRSIRVPFEDRRIRVAAETRSIRVTQ